MPLVAGVDSSTQSTKVVVVDVDSGAQVAEGRAAHAVTGTDGARETSPTQWLTALAQAIDGCGYGSQIAAISVAAQQHGLVVLGAQRQPLRPAILWNDTRSGAEAALLVDELGGPEACARLVGSVLTPAFTATSWAWLRRHEPEVAAAARAVCLPHDYITMALLGGGQVFTDRSDVSGTGWWSPGPGPDHEGYAEHVLELPSVRLRPEMLPVVLGPAEAAGKISTVQTANFGLRPGVLVGPGAGDNAAAALSLALQPGEAAISLGTSGTAFGVAARPSADPSGVVAGFASAEGRYLPLACTLNATVAVDKVATWLGLEREDVAPSDGVVFLPWLDGERTPNLPGASGTLSGLRHSTSPQAVLQAAYEGAVGTLLAAVDQLGAWAPMDEGSPILLVGGGARGRAWQQTVARLSGRRLVLPHTGELVARGAAVQAAAVLEGADPATVAARWDLRQGQVVSEVARDDALVATIGRWLGTAVSSASVPIEGLGRRRGQPFGAPLPD